MSTCPDAARKWKSYGQHIQNYPILLKMIGGKMTLDVQVSASPTGPWTTVLSGRRSSAGSLALERYDFAEKSGRYVRIVGHGNTVNAWNSLTEVEIWGSEVNASVAGVRE